MSKKSNNSLSRCFFIVGADRSGTTMLRLMLNQHPDVVVPPETWFMIDLMNKLPLDAALTESQTHTAFELITAHKRWKDLGIEDNVLRKSLECLHRPRLREVIELIFSHLLKRANKSRWGDKTPEYILEISRLHVVFPTAQFIHLIRDPRDVCISLWRKRWRGTRIVNAARYWSDYVNQGLTSGRDLSEDLYLEVHYEDLIRNTKAKLREVCAFLDLPFTPELMEFHKYAINNIPPGEVSHHPKTTRPPRPDDVELWRKNATPFQVISVEALAGATMDEVGQERHYQGLGRLLPATVRIIESSFWEMLRVRRKLSGRS